MRHFFRDQEQLAGYEESREFVSRLPPGSYILVAEAGGDVVLYRTKPACLDAGNLDPASDRSSTIDHARVNPSVAAVNRRNRDSWSGRR